MKQGSTKGLVLLTVILMDLLVGMEFDLFVPGFPQLQSQFSLTPFWVEALLSVNFAGYCVGLFLVGGLADRYGRRPIILIGLIAFTFGSMLCLWAASYNFLFVGRFLQGIGVAAPALLSFLIIADSYSLKEQQLYMAILNGIMNAATAAAPVIGSYITLYFHWQGNFVTLLLIGLLVLTMTIAFIPSYKLPEQKETLSIKGYFPIFKSSPLMLIIVSFIFGSVPYWVFVGMSPLLYLEDLGVSLKHFGYYQGSLALIFGFGSIFYGLIINRFDQKKMIYFSCLCFLTGLVLISFVTFTDSRNPLFITLSLIPFIIGQIIPATILFPICINYMPQAKGRVSAVIQTGRLVLSGIGLQVAGYYYTGSFQGIGMIIIVFILLSIISLLYVLKNRELMKFIP